MPVEISSKKPQKPIQSIELDSILDPEFIQDILEKPQRFLVPDVALSSSLLCTCKWIFDKGNFYECLCHYSVVVSGMQ